HGPYADEWRIAQSDSLFDYEPGEDTSSFVRADFPSEPARVQDLPATEVEAATAECRTAGVADPTLLFDCILDVACAADAASKQALAADLRAEPAAVTSESPAGDLWLEGAIAMDVLPAQLSSAAPPTPNACEVPLVPVIRVFEER